MQMCVGVGMGGSHAPTIGGIRGTSPGKILILGALKSAFQCTLSNQGGWHLYLTTFALFYIMFPLYILYVY